MNFSTDKPGIRRMTENESMRSAYGRGVGFFVGEPCESTCNSILFHIYCNTSTNRCECQQEYPVYINNRLCVKAAKLGEKCEYHQSCAYINVNSICHKEGDCRCDGGYSTTDELGEKLCSPSGRGSFLDNSDITTMVSVIAGLMIFTALFCLVLRLFSRARFNRPVGRLANASAPSVVLSGMERAPSVVSSRRPSRSSTSNDYLPGSRRPSYIMLAPPSTSGSRRPSSGSVRSQTSIRSYSSFRSQSSFNRNREPIRRTASSPADTHPTAPYRHSNSTTMENTKTETPLTECLEPDNLHNHK